MDLSGSGVERATVSGKAFAPPNYTKVPNLFLDGILPNITALSELKVTLAIMRQTFGWQKKEDALSLSQLEKLTGLSRKSVAEGVKLALGRGYVGRRKVGSTYVYGLRVASVDTTPPKNLPSEDIEPVASEESIPTKERVKESITPTGEVGTSAGTFCQYLREELDGADIPLLRGRLDRYGGEFKKHLDKGISADVLYKCADRIVERWTGDEHTKLTVEKALEDVVNGKPPKHVQTNGASNGTPQEVITYIFENARNPELRRYEPILRRWDFTSSEPPPFSIEKQLGGTDNERWANLNALQTLARRARRSPAKPAVA